MIVFNIEVYIHRTDVDDDQIYDDSFSPNKIEDDLSRKKLTPKRVILDLTLRVPIKLKT